MKSNLFNLSLAECGRNKIYNPCGTDCAPSQCTKFGTIEVLCEFDPTCQPGCYCKPGFIPCVEDEGICVKGEACPAGCP